MSDSSIISYNSYLTAEGLLSKVISTVPFALKDSRIILLGCGNCGSNIISVFKNLSCKIYVYDINEKKYALCSFENVFPLKLNQLNNHIEDANIIINTVPDKIIQDNCHHLIGKDTFIFDITSFHECFNNNFIKEHKINYITCPGIPGKYSPQSAGELLANKIIKHLEGNDYK